MERPFGLTLLVLALVFTMPASAVAQQLTIQELHARDVERLLTYDSLKHSRNGSAGSAVTSKCLLDDADGDGMPDSWEMEHGLDPTNPDDAWLDPDGDGVVNLFEFQLGSDPRDPASPPVATVALSGGDFTDVREAIEGVVPGTVIRVAGGTYLVNYITFNTKVVMIQGGWSADFTQRDLRQFPTIFDGQMQREILYFSFASEDNAVVLDGVRFVRGSGAFGAVNLLAQGTACMRTSIVNCSIMASESTFSFGGVLNMYTWNSSEADRTVANILLVGNASTGLYSQVTNDSRSRWRILHATISGNTNGGGSNGFGIDAFTLDQAKLAARVYNSLLWGNAEDQYDVRIDGFGKSLVFEASYSDVGSVFAIGDAIFNRGPGLVDVDPVFDDPVSGDYHLQTASPLRDAGIGTGIPLTDFEGDPRVCGDAPDIGADEICKKSRWESDQPKAGFVGKAEEYP